MFKRKGFTLIELIMVIVIIGILAAVAVPKFINLRRDAQKASCAGSAAALQTALSNYYARTALAGTGVFPSTLHSASFVLRYISDGTLPPHPRSSIDWSDYYAVNAGQDQYTFTVGTAVGATTGACTGW